MTAAPITDGLIRQHSTAESFARGQAYCHEGAVGPIVRRADTVQAEVAGSLPEPYHVTLLFTGPLEVRARCTCPYDWGGWCKHIVATLLAMLNQPESVEERPSLPALLAPLDRDALEMLLLHLTENDPSLVDVIEALIALLLGAGSMTGAMSGSRAAPQTEPAGSATPPAGISTSTPIVPAAPLSPVTVADVRRELRTVLGRGGWGRGGYDRYWGVGSIMGGVDQVLDHAWRLIDAGAGRAALFVLETITEEVWSAYEELDDSDGDGMGLFAGIGAAWAEALLSLDVTDEEREGWGVKLEAWRDELADYGLEEGFEAAVQAATQGWDDPRLVRVLLGQESRASLWREGHTAGEDDDQDDDEGEGTRAGAAEAEDLDAPRAAGGPPDWLADETLTEARLNVLARARKWDEFLRLADASGQVVAYATQLVRLGRVREAIAYGLERLATTEEALALAQVLAEQQQSQGALEIAEYGLRLPAVPRMFGMRGMRDIQAMLQLRDLPGQKATLASWTAELASRLGETARALAAAELAVRDAPTLERYQRVQELAGSEWSAHREALLAHLRSLQQGASGYVHVPGRVDIFLHEELIEDAIAAVERGASHELLERVVDAALPTHPEWVITTSRHEAEAIMDRGKSELYSAAARWLARARDAYRGAGREAEWHVYLTGLLREHGRKYRLVPLLKAL
jgi:uncharacterized Zn finger protein